MEQKYNLNNPSIKRIMREVKEMEKETSCQFKARPLEVRNGVKVLTILTDLHRITCLSGISPSKVPKTLRSREESTTEGTSGSPLLSKSLIV